MKETEDLIIRACNPGDKGNWITLNREFMAGEIKDASFWNNTDSDPDERFSRTFEEALQHPELITLLMIVKGQEAIGFANLMTVFSIWSHGRALILDDLYIRKAYRGTGYGRMVMRCIEEVGREKDVKRVQFQAEQSNLGANLFYKKLGYSSEPFNFYVKYL